MLVQSADMNSIRYGVLGFKRVRKKIRLRVILIIRIICSLRLELSSDGE